jgi:hypothetical protein
VDLLFEIDKHDLLFEGYAETIRAEDLALSTTRRPGGMIDTDHVRRSAIGSNGAP